MVLFFLVKAFDAVLVFLRTLLLKMIMEVINLLALAVFGSSYLLLDMWLWFLQEIKDLT